MEFGSGELAQRVEINPVDGSGNKADDQLACVSVEPSKSLF